MPEGREKRGHYAFRLKANQPDLYEGTVLLFEACCWSVDTVRQVDRHGDRTEIRELSVSEDLNEWAQWPHLAQVARLTYTRIQKGKTTTEVSYIITSLPADQASPERLLQLVRGHWRIENCLHWVRDVTFDEDRSQVRSGAAPQVMSAARNVAITLLRWAGASNIAAALRTCAGHPGLALALVTTP